MVRINSSPTQIRICHLSQRTLFCRVWMSTVLESSLLIQGARKAEIFSRKKWKILHTCISVKWAWVLFGSFVRFKFYDVGQRYCITSVLKYAKKKITTFIHVTKCESSAKTLLFLYLTDTRAGLREVIIEECYFFSRVQFEWILLQFTPLYSVWRESFSVMNVEV